MKASGSSVKKCRAGATDSGSAEKATIIDRGVMSLNNLAALFGEMNRRPMFLDFKVGLTNEVPDWKLQFGFNL